MGEWVEHTDEVIQLQLNLKQEIEKGNIKEIENVMNELNQIELKQIKKYINKEMN